MSVSSLPTVVTTSRLVFIILLLVNIDLSIFNRYSAAAVDAINDDVSLTSTHSIPVADDDDGIVSTIGCGTTKGCLHYPEGCHSPGDCLSVLTWRTAEPGYVDFEMMAPTDGWVAVAFSTDTHMKNDSVIQCAVNAVNSTVSVGLSYNVRSEDNNILVSANTTLLKLKSSSYVNGSVICRFQRSVPGESVEIFPLDGSYYLFFGVGPVSSDGSLQVHAQEPEKSPKPVDVTVDLEDLTPGVSTISAAASSTASPVPSSSTTDPENGDCGVTVGCFYDTAGNVVKYSATADGLNIHFEIICQRSTSGYCAVGFSNDTLMGLSSVIDCMRLDDGQFVVQHSYNGAGYSNDVVENATSGLTVDSTNYSNGVFSCRFNRSIVVDSNDRVYDLNQAYYLSLATGPLRTDGTNSKRKHDKSPSVSTEKIDVRLPPVSSTSNSSTTSTTGTTTVTKTVTTAAEGCGITYGCFYDSSGNVVKYAATDGGDDVEFEIVCQRSGGGWCSVGFSNDQRMVDFSSSDVTLRTLS